MSVPVDFIERIVTTVITVVTTAFAFVWTIKTDTRVLKERLDGVDKKLDKMDGVLIQLAETKAENRARDERVNLQGARLDELTRRVNMCLDKDKRP